MRRMRKDDEVIVITGKDKGRRGKIIRMIGYDRVVVSGINLVKRHTKANPSRGISGGIFDKEAAIHISNLMIFNHNTNKGDRIGFRILEDGRKIRYFKSNKKDLEP